MNSAELQTALTTIAAFGGIGAAIDFWIGRRGQDRVKGFLETWWLRFSYIRIRTFGREEALFAVGTMDCISGQRMLSASRVVACLVIIMTATIIALADADVRRNLTAINPGNAVASTLFSAASVCISLSITRLMAVGAAKSCGDSVVKNGIWFLAMLVTQYLMFCFLHPITQTLSGIADYLTDPQYFSQTLQEKLSVVLATTVHNRSISYLRLTPVKSVGELMQLYTWLGDEQFVTVAGAGVFVLGIISWISAAIASGYRIAVTLMFVLSYALLPLHGGISVVWARIVESDKPVFTLTMGGFAGLCKALQVLFSYS